MLSCYVWLRLGKDLPAGERDALSRQFPQVQFLSSIEPQDYASVDVVFTNSRLPDETAAELSALKWIHTTYGGGLAFLTPSVVARAVTVTCSRGVQAAPLSEFTEACVLALAKKLPAMARLKAERRWDETLKPDTLAGKTVGLLGLGAVGSSIAERLHKHGMTIQAIRRNVQQTLPCVDRVVGMDRLPEILRQSDFLIISLPGSPEMRGLIGEAQLRSMKPDSYLINLVTREIVDDADLARALRENWIAGAACNVFAASPLPADSPLWDAPNLIISPNVAQSDPQRWQKLRKVFTDNLERHLTGAPRLNVVNGGSAD